MWTSINNKDDFQEFVRIFKENKLKVQNTVIGDESDGFYNCLVADYSGKLSSEDLKVIRRAFGSEKVEVNKNYVFIKLPEELWEEA